MIGFPPLGQYGRLGNQLWQVASTIGIAHSRGEEVALPEWDYAPFFSVPEELFIPGQPVTSAAVFATHIPEAARDYLQDYSLWEEIAPTIKKYFQPSNLALETLMKHQDFWELEPPVCALHVRRGDNATEGAWKAAYHPLRPLSYYEEALELVKYQSLAIFSDDIPWCKTVFEDRADYYHTGIPRLKEHEEGYKTKPFSDWIDLQLMTYCDSHIMSNSSYSWWGAFLSEDESPIYPYPWMGTALDYIDCDLMFPPEWNRLEHEI